MKMKTSTLFLFFSLCFSLCYFAIPIPSVLADELVYDTKGNPLKPNVFYKIKSGLKVIGLRIEGFCPRLMDNPTHGLYFAFIPQDQTTTQISDITRFTITTGDYMSVVLTIPLGNCNHLFQLLRNAPDPAVFSISNTDSGYSLYLPGTIDQNNQTDAIEKTVQTDETYLLKVKGEESSSLVDLLPLTFAPSELVSDSKGNPLQLDVFYKIKSGLKVIGLHIGGVCPRLVDNLTEGLNFKFIPQDQTTTQISDITPFTITTDDDKSVVVDAPRYDIINPWFELRENAPEPAVFRISKTDSEYSLYLPGIIDQNNRTVAIPKTVQTDYTYLLKVKGGESSPPLDDLPLTFEPAG